MLLSLGKFSKRLKLPPRLFSSFWSSFHAYGISWIYPPLLFTFLSSFLPVCLSVLPSANVPSLLCSWFHWVSHLRYRVLWEFFFIHWNCPFVTVFLYFTLRISFLSVAIRIMGAWGGGCSAFCLFSPFGLRLRTGCPFLFVLVSILHVGGLPPTPRNPCWWLKHEL